MLLKKFKVISEPSDENLSDSEHKKLKLKSRS